MTAASVTAPVWVGSVAFPWRRLVGSLLVLAITLFGWILVGQQQTALWQRLPDSTVLRFIADEVDVELPARWPVQALAAVCAEAPPVGPIWNGGARQAVATCLDSPALMAQGAVATRVADELQRHVNEQLRSAQAWLTEFKATSGMLQAEWTNWLQQARVDAAAASGLGGSLSATGFFMSIPLDRRHDVGRIEPMDATAAQLRQRIQSTQAQLAELARAPASDRMRSLALLASGQQLVRDYGHTPPAVRLETDRRSLADALQRQRSARGFMQRGFSLNQLRSVPQALAASALVLLVVVLAASSGRVLPVAAWSLATLLLAVGSLALTDLALTGPEAMRYLAERQFVRLGVGDTAIPMMLAVPLGQGQVVTFWWPLLLVALSVALLGFLRDGSSPWLSPARAWVAAAEHPRHGSLPIALLMAVGVAMVLLLGMPAAVSEGLIALGVLGLATCVARQVPHANIGGGLQVSGLGVVLAAMACAVGGSIYRGDLGHALVALMVAGVFAWLFGWSWLRWSVALVVLSTVAALAQCLVSGALVGPLAWLAEHVLPPHAQDRLLAQFNPFHAAASDLARVRWLIDSAGFEGWGLGYVPWQGLAAGHLQDGLPLQGPSDYVLAVVSALWGRAGGLALMATVLVLFTVAAVMGLRTALAMAMPPAVRALAAAGGFGCLVMAFKVVLSVGGVSGVLPLTGLPVALLGYGPMTLGAALLYLSLALGTLHVRPVERSRGVNLQSRTTLAGAVHRRGTSVALAGVAGIGLLLVMGERHLRSGVGPEGDHHLSSARMQLAQTLATSMVPAGGAAEPAVVSMCPELRGAIEAWNVKLGRLSTAVRIGPAAASPAVQALRLDASHLLEQLPPQTDAACRRLARTMGQMVDSDLPRLVGQPAASAAGSVASGAMAAPLSDSARFTPFEKPRALGARPADYTTRNMWWGLPGCLHQLGPSTAQPTRMSTDACDPAGEGMVPVAKWGDVWLTDIWLQRELSPQLHLALRQPAGQRTLNHRTVAIGDSLGLSLDASLQPLAQRLADCYTGRLDGDDCAAVLPRDAQTRDRHFGGKGAVRAGALGLVLVDVESGRIVALAGALSDCSLDHLGRAAKADPQGRVLALLPGELCAQLPDRRSAWMALQHPALWMVAPGSSLKELAVVAAIDAGLLPPGRDDAWKRIIAESHERLPIQRLAQMSGQHFLDVLSQVGYGRGPLDLMWGGPAQAPQTGVAGGRWGVEAYQGIDDLKPTRMSVDEAERIRAEKLRGINVDLRYGRAIMSEFLATRRLADASVGGGDIRVNAVGLAAMWRALDLRSRGHDHAVPVHLLERTGRVALPQALTWASAGAAQRALAVTSGVTSSAWKGTAQGACRVVFGTCPAQGLPGVSGKTGSSDFLADEDSPWVKPGQQVPSKLFGGVFTAANGKRYAVAATALRVRQGASSTLELSSSAPAEAALTVMREMGVQNQPRLTNRR